jgi:hypothetical protein
VHTRSHIHVHLVHSSEPEVEPMSEPDTWPFPVSAFFAIHTIVLVFFLVPSFYKPFVEYPNCAGHIAGLLVGISLITTM